MLRYHALVDGAVNGPLDSTTMKKAIPGSGQSIPKAQIDAD
jgi:hypothetical protein